MFKLITEEQKYEIAELATEHKDALAAFGGTLYRDGLIKGGIFVIGACVAATVISLVADDIKKYKQVTKG